MISDIILIVLEIYIFRVDFCNHWFGPDSQQIFVILLPELIFELTITKKLHVHSHICIHSASRHQPIELTRLTSVSVSSKDQLIPGLEQRTSDVTCNYFS